MRFFQKLSVLAPPDPYTQGQISSLLSSDTGPAYATRAVPAAVPASPRTVPAAAPARPTAPVVRLAGAAAALVLVVLVGAWWARRAPKLPEGVAAQPFPTPALAAARPAAPSADDALTRLLDRGAAIEKESGAAKAWDFYAESAGKASRDETRAALYRSMVELARRLEDKERVFRSLDGLAAVRGARGEALLMRGEYLESLRLDSDAVRTYEEARTAGDPSAARAATIRLAQAAERGQDALRAQTLYEEILRGAPDTPEALPARLGLAALYRAAGRRQEARRLYEDLVRVAPPGGEFARSAEAALREMDAAPAPPAEARP